LELGAVIINPLNQNYSDIKSTSILKQQDVGGKFLTDWNAEKRVKQQR
jgi:hypothetical protein